MDFIVRIIGILPVLAVHLCADRFGRLPLGMRTRFGSFAGGVATSYVFLLILPKLADQQATLERVTSEWLLVEYLYHHAYLVALAGFAAYYLVNVLALTDRAFRPTGRKTAVAAGFCAYNSLIGDLIATQDPGGFSAVLLPLALALHLLGMNFEVYGRLSRSWRWLRPLLVMSLLLGWLAGILSPIPPVTHALLSAWLGGAIIIHVIVFELPEERVPWAFVTGVLTFAALIKATLILAGREGGV